MLIGLTRAISEGLVIVMREQGKDEEEDRGNKKELGNITR